MRCKAVGLIRQSNGGMENESSCLGRIEVKAMQTEPHRREKEQRREKRSINAGQ